MLWTFLFLQAVLADDCEIITDGSSRIFRDTPNCFVIRDCIFQQITTDTETSEFYVIQLGSMKSMTGVTVTGITMTDCSASSGCFLTYSSGPVAISHVCVHNCATDGAIFSAWATEKTEVDLSTNETSFVSCGEREGYLTITKLLELNGVRATIASVSISNINVSGCNIGTSTGSEMISSDTAVAFLRMLTVSNSYCGNYNGGSVFGVNGMSGTDQSGTIEMVNVVANEFNTALKTVGQATWSDSVFKQNKYQQFATSGQGAKTQITLKDCYTDREISGTDYLTIQNVIVQEDPATKEISGLNTALCPGNGGDEEEEGNPTSIPTAEEEEEQNSPSENPDEDTPTRTLEDSPTEPDDQIPVGPGDDSTNNKRLSGGEIAGIVIGVCAAVGLIAVGAFMLFAKRRKDALLESESLG